MKKMCKITEITKKNAQMFGNMKNIFKHTHTHTHLANTSRGNVINFN
jgi:hypothetical protein